mgnify:CR=1 FL=1
MTDFFITNLKEMMELARRINNENDSLRDEGKKVTSEDIDRGVIGLMKKQPKQTESVDKQYNRSQLQALSLAADLNTIDEALRYHIDRLTTNPEALEDLYTLIDIGYPLRSLAESMTSVAVMEGIHSIDISLSLNTTLYQELVELAEEANLDYITGLEEDDVAKKEKQEQKLEA